jgi:hypothetical protein
MNVLWNKPEMKKQLYDVLAGGGRAPTINRPIGPCSCRRGRILIDATTREEVGEEVFFYDTEEGAYSLYGRFLSTEDLRTVDWSTPAYDVPARYIGPDGRIHGTLGCFEYCSRCESTRRSEHDMVFQWTVISPSGRRHYRFRIEPHASNTIKRAFTELISKCGPKTPRERREFMLASFLFFGEYSSIGRLSERSLASRFRVTRGRLRSIRARYARKLSALAVSR